MKNKNPDWSVRSGYVDTILKIAGQLGVSSGWLQKEVALDDGWNSKPDRRLPVQIVYDLTRLTAVETGNENIGLYLGRANYLNIVNLLLYLSTLCNSLRQWLNLMPSVLEMSGDIGETAIVREGDLIGVEWRPLVPLSVSDRYIIDMILSTSVSILGSICYQPIVVKHARFTYPEPADTRLLQQCFGSELSFDQSSSCIYVDIESLDYRLIEPDSELSDEVTSTWQRVVGHDVSDEFIGCLRRVILSEMPTGQMTIDSIARELGVSRRTLQRRLSDRKSSFLHEVQELRAGMAKQLLADKRMGITEIAFLLGYSDSSSFSSAFKGWFGVSPRDYRH